MGIYTWNDDVSIKQAKSSGQKARGRKSMPLVPNNNDRGIL
jgi:hypothetical protein